MSGGFNGYDSMASKPERLDLLVEAIKGVNADFVSLVDTHRWTEVFTPDDLRGLFGYENVYFVGLNDQRLKVKGHDNGIAVLTRLPITRFETVRLATRNAIRSVIMNGGKELEIFSVYLDDLSEDTRLRQVMALLGLIDFAKPTVFAGDLNTISASEVPEARENIEKLFSRYPQARVMEPSLREMMRGEVIKKIEERGFVDMGKGAGNTIPSKLSPIPIDRPLLRLDYGFCTKGVVVEGFEVLREEIFDKVSDHYPIRMKVSLG